MRTFLFIAVLLVLSCEGNAQFKKHENIRFDVAIERVADNPDVIKVNGTLFNPNKDTVYFLTSSCDGTRDLLKYDSANFQQEPGIRCNLSVPITAVIPPKGRLDFSVNLKIIKPVEETKLGFFFGELEEFYQRDDPRFKRDRLGIFLWAPVKTID